MSKAEVFGVVWLDAQLGGMPLTLRKDTEIEAVQTAQSMFAKAGDSLVGLRAVRVAEGSDELETLWRAVE